MVGNFFIWNIFSYFWNIFGFRLSSLLSPKTGQTVQPYSHQQSTGTHGIRLNTIPSERKEIRLNKRNYSANK